MIPAEVSVDRGERAWPVALLLEELRLRSRRRLIGELERRCMWPDRARHRSHVRAQRAAGQRLRDHTLRAALDAASFSLLDSRTVFRSANRRIAARLPFVLAFGYDLGAGLHELRSPGDDDASARAGARAALFNFGISLFDVVCDNLPELCEQISEVLDERRLADLAEDARAADELAEEAARLDEPELRLLMTVVAAFFRLGPCGDGDPTPRLPRQLLERAYRAEMRSVSSTAIGREQALVVAREKATLPFLAIGAIAGHEPGRDARADRLVNGISVAFWRTDDLVDAAMDFRSGALNSLLVEASGGEFGPGSYAGATGAEGLARLLDAGALERAVHDVGVHMAEVVDILTTAVPGAGARRLAEVLVCSLRDWIE